jgi:hypothetical protein
MAETQSLLDVSKSILGDWREPINQSRPEQVVVSKRLILELTGAVAMAEAAKPPENASVVRVPGDHPHTFHPFTAGGQWLYANYPGQLPANVREAQERSGYTKDRPKIPDSPSLKPVLTVAEKAAVLDWLLSSPRKDPAQAFTSGDQRCLADLLDCRYAERSTAGQLNKATEKVNAMLGVS